MKVLKAIGRFFKSRKVQLWALIMIGVIVASFCIMSWIMVANKITFAKIENRDYVSNQLISSFDFVPNRNSIDTVTILHEENDDFSGSAQLNNNMIDGKHDPVVFESEGKIIENILKLLNKGRKTNRFLQFFTGGDEGKERVQLSHTGSWAFEELSDGVSIRIVFATPQFVINRYEKGSTIGAWEIQQFNPDYDRPLDEYDRPYGRTQRQYNNSVIHAIHIPLGFVKNSFTQQTWYLSVGTREINSNPTSMGYTFTTYGNYYPLRKYVVSMDDQYVLFGE